MNQNFKFPTEGWRFAGSNSYGTAELYHNIPKVVVKQFMEDDSELAKQTHQFLKVSGVISATIEEVKHIDNKVFLYVFAERQEFLNYCDRLFPGIQISAERI